MTPTHCLLDGEASFIFQNKVGDNHYLVAERRGKNLFRKKEGRNSTLDPGRREGSLRLPEREDKISIVKGEGERGSFFSS